MNNICVTSALRRPIAQSLLLAWLALIVSVSTVVVASEDIKEIQREYQTTALPVTAKFITRGMRKSFGGVLPPDSIDDQKAKDWFKTELYKIRPGVLSISDVSYTIDWLPEFTPHTISKITFKAHFKE